MSVLIAGLFVAVADKYTFPQAFLSLKALTHILIDASHQDAKTMTIFDLAEIRLASLIAMYRISNPEYHIFQVLSIARGLRESGPQESNRQPQS